MTRAALVTHTHTHTHTRAQGLDYLLDTVWGPILQRIRTNGLSLDHLIAWPYDWGGCGCAVDWPWGSVGFPRFSSAVLAKARTSWGHPNVQVHSVHLFVCLFVFEKWHVQAWESIVQVHNINR
jgi:hypothetical protein